jgi:hypothetical protein
MQDGMEWLAVVAWWTGNEKTTWLWSSGFQGPDPARSGRVAFLGLRCICANSASQPYWMLAVRKNGGRDRHTCPVASLRSSLPLPVDLHALPILLPYLRVVTACCVLLIAGNHCAATASSSPLKAISQQKTGVSSDLHNASAQLSRVGTGSPFSCRLPLPLQPGCYPLEIWKCDLQ